MKDCVQWNSLYCRISSGFRIRDGYISKSALILLLPRYHEVDFRFSPSRSVCLNTEGRVARPNPIELLRLLINTGIHVHSLCHHML